MRRTFWSYLVGGGRDCMADAAAGAEEPCMQAGDGRRPMQLPVCQMKCHPAPAYNLAPGCCEPRRHCFDNAWDGYCEQRARWDTFWCKVGTGALFPCRPCSTYDGRGVALEVQLRPSAAACAACQKH